jgi:hypothetical protein
MLGAVHDRVATGGLIGLAFRRVVSMVIDFRRTTCRRRHCEGGKYSKRGGDERHMALLKHLALG